MTFVDWLMGRTERQQAGKARRGEKLDRLRAKSAESSQRLAETSQRLSETSQLISERRAENAAASRLAAEQRGPTGPAAIVCPHCGTTGKVKVRTVKAKAGVSGAKATGAVLTGGVSVLATGLSRKSVVTAMKCGQCKTAWTVS